MANWIGAWRTEEFRVKSARKVRKLCEEFSIHQDGTSFHAHCFWRDYDKKTKSVTFGCGGYESLPVIWDENLNDERSFIEELLPLIKKDELLIVTEVGYEKLRYLTGVTWIYKNQKLIKTIDLSNHRLTTQETNA